jgi:hypothetical protein
MKTPMQHSTITYTVLGTALCVLSLLPQGARAQDSAVSDDQVMCTMDAMMCPDGSYVGRSGPNCEFVCPLTEDTTNDPASSTGSLPLPATTTAEVEIPDEVNPSSLRPAIPLGQVTETTLSEIRQTRIINLAANMSNRLDAAIDRFFSITSRLEIRIQILKQRGQDTTAAETALRTASQTLALAKSQVSDIDAKVYEATTADEPYTKWRSLAEHYVVVATTVRTAQNELRAVVAALKNPIPTPTPEAASSTEASTDTPTPAPL